jgi:hypothetical protein
LGGSLRTYHEDEKICAPLPLCAVEAGHLAQVGRSTSRQVEIAPLEMKPGEEESVNGHLFKKTTPVAMTAPCVTRWFITSDCFQREFESYFF